MSAIDGVEERVKQVLADILDVKPTSIDESTAMDSVDTWDSLTHINLCLALEQEFQVAFEVKEIETMLSYPDVLEVLLRKI
jgi:acyl carrier protein